MQTMTYENRTLELNGLDWRIVGPLENADWMEEHHNLIDVAVWRYWTAGLRYLLAMCRYSDKCVNHCTRMARESVRHLRDEGILSECAEKRAKVLIDNAAASRKAGKFKMTDKMREEFEAFRDKRNSEIEAEGWKPGSRWHVTNAHYATWQASRAALVVTLPEVSQVTDIAYYKADIMDALTAAGVAYK